MSGLEVLGLACNIFQTISFARETVLICRDVYRGHPTADSRLEENVTAMIEAARQVKESCRTINTPEERYLADVADRCTNTAEELELKVRKITQKHGRGSVISAVRVRFSSLWKKGEIEDLNKALNDHKSTMQTLLSTHICDKINANNIRQLQCFQGLNQDLQYFILQISAGHTEMEDLLKTQTLSTQDHASNEIRRAEKSVKDHLINEIHTREIRSVSKTQCDRLLRSLKFEDMNIRRNNILDPEEVTFERIFLSYKNTAYPKHDITCIQGLVCSRKGGRKQAIYHPEPVPGNNLGGQSVLYEHDDNYTESLDSNGSIENLREIDIVWQKFVDWLRSGGDLFWIQGKPGSGKSTLMKHIIHHNATFDLLHQWNPSTRILSHFFWKVGSPMQSNIRGLYCTLLHQLLEGEERLISYVSQNFPFATKKDHHSDWSARELEQVILGITSMKVCQNPLCIFIDGLDEYCGQDGQEGLLNRINHLTRNCQVKVCVASRSEPLLQQELGKSPNLKLHHLTRPDMQAFARLELGDFVRDGLIYVEHSSALVDILLAKSEGVFLWLRLALKSIKSGIRNRDPGELLIRRLQQLPDELETLYADMWTRLNQDEPIYRKSAANYFRFLIWTRESPDYYLTYRDSFVPGYLPSIRLFALMCATNNEMQDTFLDTTQYPNYDYFQSLCEITESQIHAQCAGLMEVRPWKPESVSESDMSHRLQIMLKNVDFIHRTAYDFLVNTVAGQKVLSYGTLSSADISLRVTKSCLCTGRLLAQQAQNTNLFQSLYASSILDLMKDLWISEGWGHDTIFQLLHTTRSLYDTGNFRNITQYPKTHFLSTIITSYPKFDDFALYSIGNTISSVATTVLRELKWIKVANEGDGPSTTVIQKLLSKDGDPFDIADHITDTLGPNDHYYATRTGTFWDLLLEEFNILERYYVTRTNAFWNLLSQFHYYNMIQFTDPYYVADMVVAMLQSRASVPQRGLIPATIKETDGLWGVNIIRYPDENQEAAILLFEVNSDFLLKGLLRALSRADATKPVTKYRAILENIVNPQVCLRFIRIPPKYSGRPWFQVVDQTPLEGVIPYLNSLEQLHSKESRNWLAKWIGLVMNLIRNPNVLLEINEEDILKVSAEEGWLGPRRFEDLGFVHREQLRDELDSYFKKGKVYAIR